MNPLVDPSTAAEAYAVTEFATLILHGDPEHRAWLLEAARAFCAGHALPPPRAGNSQKTDSFLADLREWQLATFPDETLVGVYEHLREEIDELGECFDRGGADKLWDPESELADCLMLLCCLCFRHGVDPIAVMQTKHRVNLLRDWKKTERGYRHA